MSGSVVPTVLVHGGAGRVARVRTEAAIAGVRAAAQAGQRALAEGSDAVAAAVAAVRVLEDDPTFNAGRGSAMTRDGTYEVDAAIMRSRDRRIGGIAGVTDLADAILVARAVLEHTPHNLLVGAGAEAFARARGVGTFSRTACHTDKAQRRYEQGLSDRAAVENLADTVGAVVIDVRGDLCAAGSTGGTAMKLSGRVGDTPIAGAGLFADPGRGAAAATGVGEAIMRHVLCFSVLDEWMRAAAQREADAHDAEGFSQAASALALTACQRASEGAHAIGVIGIDGHGVPFIAHVCEHMSWGLARGDGPVRTGLRAPTSARVAAAGAP